MKNKGILIPVIVIVIAAAVVTGADAASIATTWGG